ncbi:hypothetical protein CP533_1321 [Ophiocordyceps camponoti-saundersi (nom. inval.)]|nr:hypothetical protein CP533_1321 [Ophiocordyceps camponoti-saundersi (nom. inval.)]
MSSVRQRLNLIHQKYRSCPQEILSRAGSTLGRDSQAMATTLQGRTPTLPATSSGFSNVNDADSYIQLLLLFPADATSAQIVYRSRSPVTGSLIRPDQSAAKIHAVRDCSRDVTLTKLAAIVYSVVTSAWFEAARLGWIVVRPPPDALFEAPNQPHQTKFIAGTRFLGAWNLAFERRLGFDSDVMFDIPAMPTDISGLIHPDEFDTTVLRTLQQRMRSEVDCHICYHLLYDPYTTPCGHTFCRHCLLQALFRHDGCPICRRPLDIDLLLKPDTCPANERIIAFTRTFWNDELDGRKEAYVAGGFGNLHLFHVPLLICGLSFPGQPMYVQIFEPQYHRMLQRVLDGDRKFGLVMPRDPERLGDGFYPIGILLNIKDHWDRRDGRSLVELQGLTRFRVLNSYTHEGYTVGISEAAEDVGVEQEEAMEAAEVGYDASDSAAGCNHLYDYYDTRDEESAATAPFWTSWRQFGSDMPECETDLNAMTTESLMRFAMSFVDRAQEKKLPWLSESVIQTYGRCPDDPLLFPWWFGSTLPISNPQKVKLISAFSVRDRLKICGSWILEMRRKTR